MDIIITNDIVNCLMISSVVSIINVTLIQKFKEFSFINSENYIFLLNLIFSFVVGICFSMTFYKVSFYCSIWIFVFSFIGAPNIYNLLKKKNVISDNFSENKKKNND